MAHILYMLYKETQHKLMSQHAVLCPGCKAFLPRKWLSMYKVVTPGYWSWVTMNGFKTNLLVLQIIGSCNQITTLNKPSHMMKNFMNWILVLLSALKSIERKIYIFCIQHQANQSILHKYRNKLKIRHGLGCIHTRACISQP